jgi:hypothetical protein
MRATPAPQHLVMSGMPRKTDPCPSPDNQRQERDDGVDRHALRSCGKARRPRLIKQSYNGGSFERRVDFYLEAFPFLCLSTSEETVSFISLSRSFLVLESQSISYAAQTLKEKSSRFAYRNANFYRNLLFRRASERENIFTGGK